jgi:hypothetical protein
MDESMLRYVGDFKRFDFHNIKPIQFFNADDFDAAVVRLPTKDNFLGLKTFCFFSFPLYPTIECGV